MHKKLLDVYILTFLTCFSISISVAAFTYSKKDIVQAFAMTTFEMGIADAIHCATAICGILFLMFSPQLKSSTSGVFLTGYCVYSFGSLIMPLAYGLQIRSKYAIFLSQAVFGSTYSILFPPILLILKEYRARYGSAQNSGKKSEQSLKDRFILSVWANANYISAICANFLFDYLSYQMKVQWFTLMTSAAIFQIMVCCATYVYLKQNALENYETSSEGDSNLNSGQKIDFRVFLKVFFKSRERTEIAIIYFTVRTVTNQTSFVTVYYLTLLGYEGNQGKIMSMYCLCCALSPLVISGIDYILINTLGSISQSFPPGHLNASQSLSQEIRSSRLRSKEKEGQSRNEHNMLSLSSALALVVSCIILGLIVVIEKTSQNAQDEIRSSEDFVLMMLLFGAYGLFVGGPSNLSYTKNIIELLGDESLIKQIHKLETLNRIGQSSDQGGLPSEISVKGDFWLMDKDTCVLGCFQVVFQVLSVGLFLISYKILSTSPELFMVSLIILLIVAAVTDLFKGLNSLKIGL